LPVWLAFSQTIENSFVKKPVFLPADGRNKKGKRTDLIVVHRMHALIQRKIGGPKEK